MKRITADGRPVIDIFDVYDTHGVPLDMAISAAIEAGHAVDWIEFWVTSVRRGWNPRSTLAKLSEAVGDALGPAFHAGWLPRMKLAIIDIERRWRQTDAAMESLAALAAWVLV